MAYGKKSAPKLKKASVKKGKGIVSAKMMMKGPMMMKKAQMKGMK